jgi:hypothetical protein
MGLTARREGLLAATRCSEAGSGGGKDAAAEMAFLAVVRQTSSWPFRARVAVC